MAQSPHFELFKVIKNKKNVEVNAIFQDKAGFLWIGTNQGLVKHDGIEFTPYTIDDSLSSNEVTAITQDSTGILWIGHNNGTITRYDGAKFSIFKPEEGLSNVPISNFLVSKSNTIWFTTKGEGVYYWGGKNRKRVYNINTDDGLLDNYTYAIVQGSNANIYIATDKGISIYNTTKNAIEGSITMLDGLPDNIVKHLCYTPDKKLWIGMEDGGICCYEVDKKRFNTVGNWNFGSINDFITINPSEFWISTKRNGVVKLNIDASGAAWYKVFGKAQGLAGPKTNSVYLDREHNVWVGTSDGVAIRKNNSIEFLDDHDNFKIQNIFSLAFDKSGNTWIASQEGLYKVICSKTGEITTKKLFDNSTMRQQSFISVFCDTKGSIWAGTYGYGVYQINPETLSYKAFSTTDGLANNNVIAISGNDDTILFSTLGGGVSVYNPNKGKAFTTLSTNNGLTSDYIYNSFIDSKKRLWFATDGGGIACRYNSIFKNCYNKKDTLFPQVFYSIIEDQKGQIWFASADKGIYIYNGQKFKSINEINGLRTNSIRSMTITPDGRIVLVSNEGIDVYESKSETFEYWGEDDKVVYLEPNLNATATDASGKIWIGTQDGIVILSPTKEPDIQQEPNLQITSKLLFSKPIPESKIKFNYRENYLTFHYIALWYKAPSKLLYRYKLEGADMEWSAPTRTLQVTYSNLSSGKYRFVVEVSHIPGKWIGSPNATFAFTIRPPFYFTWWFTITVVLGIVFGIFAFIRYRTIKLERDKDILEDEVRKRTNEIQMQKEEIEAQRDEIEVQHHYVTKQRDQIASKNKDINSSIEYASRIQTAMLPPVEIIKKCFADYFILFKPRDIVSGDFYYFNQRQGEIIFGVADCTGHGVPGAFMSMLGVSLLNEIVRKKEVSNAAQILEQLRSLMIDALRQKGELGEQKDGMDIAICVLNTQTLVLQFAGANNPMYIVNAEKILTTVEADKQPVAIYEKMRPFSNHEIVLQKGDSLYLSSDGYKDQFGGESGKKFMAKQLRELLVAIAHKPMDEQRNILDQTFETWKGDQKQVDDVAIIGMKV